MDYVWLVVAFAIASFFVSWVVCWLALIASGQSVDKAMTEAGGRVVVTWGIGLAALGGMLALGGWRFLAHFMRRPAMTTYGQLTAMEFNWSAIIMWTAIFSAIAGLMAAFLDQDKLG